MADVPCNGCTACCSGTIMLHPALGDDPSKYETEEITGAGLALKRTTDGRCRYLGRTGCSIWPDTPAVCRAFDCREYVKIADLYPNQDRAVIERGRSLSE